MTSPGLLDLSLSDLDRLERELEDDILGLDARSESSVHFADALSFSFGYSDPGIEKEQGAEYSGRLDVSNLGLGSENLGGRYMSNRGSQNPDIVLNQNRFGDTSSAALESATSVDTQGDEHSIQIRVTRPSVAGPGIRGRGDQSDIPTSRWPSNHIRHSSENADAAYFASNNSRVPSSADFANADSVAFNDTNSRFDAQPTRSSNTSLYSNSNFKNINNSRQSPSPLKSHSFQQPVLSSSSNHIPRAQVSSQRIHTVARSEFLQTSTNSPTKSVDLQKSAKHLNESTSNVTAVRSAAKVNLLKPTPPPGNFYRSMDTNSSDSSPANSSSLNPVGGMHLAPSHAGDRSANISTVVLSEDQNSSTKRGLFSARDAMPQKEAFPEKERPRTNRVASSIASNSTAVLKSPSVVSSKGVSLATSPVKSASPLGLHVVHGNSSNSWIENVSPPSFLRQSGNANGTRNPSKIGAGDREEQQRKFFNQNSQLGSSLKPRRASEAPKSASYPVWSGSVQAQVDKAGQTLKHAVSMDGGFQKGNETGQHRRSFNENIPAQVNSVYEQREFGNPGAAASSQFGSPVTPSRARTASVSVSRKETGSRALNTAATTPGRGATDFAMGSFSDRPSLESPVQKTGGSVYTSHQEASKEWRQDKFQHPTNHEQSTDSNMSPSSNYLANARDVFHQHGDNGKLNQGGKGRSSSNHSLKDSKTNLSRSRDSFPAESRENLAYETGVKTTGSLLNSSVARLEQTNPVVYEHGRINSTRHLDSDISERFEKLIAEEIAEVERKLESERMRYSVEPSDPWTTENPSLSRPPSRAMSAAGLHRAEGTTSRNLSRSPSRPTLPQPPSRTISVSGLNRSEGVARSQNPSRSPSRPSLLLNPLTSAQSHIASTEPFQSESRFFERTEVPRSRSASRSPSRPTLSPDYDTRSGSPVKNSGSLGNFSAASALRTNLPPRAQNASLKMNASQSSLKIDERDRFASTGSMTKLSQNDLQSHEMVRGRARQRSRSPVSFEGGGIDEMSEPTNFANASPMYSESQASPPLLRMREMRDGSDGERIFQLPQRQSHGDFPSTDPISKPPRPYSIQTSDLLAKMPPQPAAPPSAVSHQSSLTSLGGSGPGATPNLAELANPLVKGSHMNLTEQGPSMIPSVVDKVEAGGKRRLLGHLPEDEGSKAVTHALRTLQEKVSMLEGERERARNLIDTLEHDLNATRQILVNERSRGNSSAPVQQHQQRLEETDTQPSPSSAHSRIPRERVYVFPQEEDMNARSELESELEIAKRRAFVLERQLDRFRDLQHLTASERDEALLEMRLLKERIRNGERRLSMIHDARATSKSRHRSRSNSRSRSRKFSANANHFEDTGEEADKESVDLLDDVEQQPPRSTLETSTVNDSFLEKEDIQGVLSEIEFVRRRGKDGVMKIVAAARDTQAQPVSRIGVKELDGRRRGDSSKPLQQGRPAVQDPKWKRIDPYRSTAPTNIASVNRQTHNRSLSRGRSSSHVQSGAAADTEYARDMPFVVGMSTNKSHSVTANLQSVYALLKSHNPALCSVCTMRKKRAASAARSRSPSHSRPQHEDQAIHHEKIAAAVGTGLEDSGKLKSVLTKLQQDFHRLKLHYHSLVQYYDSVSEDLARSKKPKSEKARLHEIGRELKEIIQRMEAKSDQISILRDILSGNKSEGSFKAGRAEKGAKHPTSGTRSKTPLPSRAPQTNPRHSPFAHTVNEQSEHEIYGVEEGTEKGRWASSQPSVSNRSCSPNRKAASLTLLRSSLKVQQAFGDARK
ncbi:Centrosomal protein cep57L1 [Chytriomyces hyalinus]|nr:Centrosomal protein cep57L1 [Chytriomyces hyalinus]